MLIGLIADTHNVLDRRIRDRFSGVDHILHAGDVCRPILVTELEAIAPVTVAAGNNDSHPGWPETVVVELAGHRILVRHILTPGHPAPGFDRDLARSGAGIVVFGHTHRPYQARLGGVLYLNPGSAGSPRSGLPRTVALLRLDGDRVDVGFVDLDGVPWVP